LKIPACGDFSQLDWEAVYIMVSQDDIEAGQTVEPVE
jgi:hypothetical protein